MLSGFGSFGMILLEIERIQFWGGGAFCGMSTPYVYLCLVSVFGILPEVGFWEILK